MHETLSLGVVSSARCCQLYLAVSWVGRPRDGYVISCAALLFLEFRYLSRL